MCSPSSDRSVRGSLKPQAVHFESSPLCALPPLAVLGQVLSAFSVLQKVYEDTMKWQLVSRPTREVGCD